MSMSDPLADMLTRIRNASMVKHDTVKIPHSKLKAHVAENLKKEGFIRGFSVIEDSTQGSIQIDLKYTNDDTAVITGIKRVSKPGCRVYVQSSDIPKVMSGLGISILSTSQGVLTDKEARKLNVGGELLCDVW